MCICCVQNSQARIAICYSKLNLGSKFHAEVATHFLLMKLRTLYTFNIIL